MIKENLIKMYEQSFRDNWELSAVSDYGTDTTYHYSELAAEISRLRIAIIKQVGDTVVINDKHLKVF